jgi:hypothetical protein
MNQGSNYYNLAYQRAFGGPPPGASLPREVPQRGLPRQSLTPQELAIAAAAPPITYSSTTAKTSTPSTPVTPPPNTATPSVPTTPSPPPSSDTSSSYKEKLEQIAKNLTAPAEARQEAISQKYQPPSFNIDEFQDLLTRLESSKKAQVAQKGTEGRRGIMSKGMQSMFRTF